MFGIHLYLRTWHDALGHRPAMVVGTSLETWTSVQMPPAPLETGLLEPFIYMDASYRKEALPDLDQMFSNSCIYWRDRREGQRG